MLERISVFCCCHLCSCTQLWWVSSSNAYNITYEGAVVVCLHVLLCFDSFARRCMFAALATICSLYYRQNFLEFCHEFILMCTEVHSCCWTSFTISMSVAWVTAELAELKDVSVALVVGHPHLVVVIHRRHCRVWNLPECLYWQMAVKVGLIMLAEMDFHFGPCTLLCRTSIPDSQILL